MAVTVLLAGFFAFSPVDQAVTVHTTIIAASYGPACATESVTMDAGAPDNDTISFTFDDPVVLVTLRGEATGTYTGGADGWGVDVLTLDTVTIDIGAGPGVDAIDPDEEILHQFDFTNDIIVQSNITFTINDTDNDLDPSDVIDFAFCVIVTDPANFTDASITTLVTAV